MRGCWGTVHVRRTRLLARRLMYCVTAESTSLRLSGRNSGSEPISLQALHILAHLRQQLIVGISLAQHLLPGHQTADGGAQLVGCLLAQSHPHLILLGPLAAQQGKDGYHHKDEHQSKLHIGPPGQAAQQEAVGIAYLHIVGGREIHPDDAPGIHHGLCLSLHRAHLLLGAFLAQGDVAIVLHLPLAIEHHHRDGAVAVEHGKHQSEVGIFVRTVERAHSLGPYLHLALLLMLEVTHQEMGYDERPNAHHHGHHHEQDLHLPHSVYPLHRT